MPNYSHLHCHTQYSLLDGAANIKSLYKKAHADGMKGIAITDHGNMFGVFEFVAEANKYKGDIKPIVGCEFYLVEDRTRRNFTKDDKDRRYHQLFLAKNAEGYRNLVKLCSLGYIEGLYGKFPRIDKELVLKYHKGLIATTCCIGALVPQTILKKGEAEARKEFEWWLNIFGEDYYIELQRHNMPEQDRVNEVLLRFAKDYGVKIICSNDSHYVDQQDWNAHDILLCINTGEKQTTSAIREYVEEGSVVKGRRFAFWNDQFYFKTQAEMGRLFADLPQALDNTNEILGKVELLKLKQDIMLPNFIIPKHFSSQDEYLRHLTFEGARQRYKFITPEIEERLNFELRTIETMGFAGYFLIVADFIKAGRDLGVFVGPGRGSAAGSVVAYCTGITNVDPIKYQLLFERFLNPDRKSMPDIDTDFDDEGRQKVLDYVANKYGRQQVAQIVTYGTMAAKMSIKDVARVLDLPLDRSTALAKLVPDKPGISLKRLFHAPLDGEGSLKSEEGLTPDDLENVRRLREIKNEDNLEAKVLNEALVLEGSVRGTGIHAAGVIIAPKDITDIIPVFTSKETDFLISQYEGVNIEEAGVIKMDFLGLKTLTIIRDTLQLIEQNHGVKIHLDDIPLNDKKTYELYQRGETNGTFQFESAGMQKYLRELKPDKFEDLIAMNALFRPGPMENIPKFIARKNGREPVEYDLPIMETYLNETYGVAVYQEQIMLLSQVIANFTKGDADMLRKAMSKKQKDTLDKMKDKFIEGGVKNGYPADRLDKIWRDWQAFASYAFNKSHSTCYALLAYQTAYLKVHYPAEYMAAVLTHSQSNIEKITFFLEECRRMGITVRHPDINESDLHFSVNKKGEIRYGLGAVKGVGEAAVRELIEERKKNGAFRSIFDFLKRINLRTVNKRVMENLVCAGAFDELGQDKVHRATFFQKTEKYDTFIEELLKFGAAFQADMALSSSTLFGDLTHSVSIAEPPIPPAQPWGLITRLNKEKEVVGIYLSGHPLDEFRFEWENFAIPIHQLENHVGRKVHIAGFVAHADHRINQKGSGWGRFTVQDFSGEIVIHLFSENYQRFRHFFEEGMRLYIQGEYKKRFNSEEMELKVSDVRLLENIGEEKTESVTVRLPLHLLSKDLMTDLDAIIKNHRGSHQLKIELFDTVHQHHLKMVSKSRKVRVNQDFLNQLTRLGLEYGVNV